MNFFQKIIMHLEEETEKSSKYFKKLTQTGKLTNVMYFFLLLVPKYIFSILVHQYWSNHLTIHIFDPKY